MSHIEALDDAIAAVETADTVLDELSAVHALELLICRVRRALVVAALEVHSAGEVGRALGGKSRQAVRQTYGQKGDRVGERRRPGRSQTPTRTERSSQ